MILSLSGLNVVITGTLRHMTREKAKALITAAGGKATNKVTSKTDILVITDEIANARIITGKVAAYIDLKEQGSDIEVLSEEEFYDYI